MSRAIGDSFYFPLSDDTYNIYYYYKRKFISFFELIYSEKINEEVRRNIRKFIDKFYDKFGNSKYGGRRFEVYVHICRFGYNTSIDVVGKSGTTYPYTIQFFYAFKKSINYKCECGLFVSRDTVRIFHNIDSLMEIIENKIFVLGGKENCGIFFNT